MTSELVKIPVLDIFKDAKYIVPIYQRNYAWDKMEIEQLIEDIENENKEYFLGNLIVNKRDNNIYEVIDGQQRLITLYLLKKYLRIAFSKEALRFEAREKSNYTLDCISDIGNLELSEKELSQEIFNGYKIIENYFKHKNIDGEFLKKIENVFLIRVQVPRNIDLNHYFEIMNTRGEQLELHEIAKAKILEVLGDKDNKNLAALIWEKCSDMNSYIQMNFDMEMRKFIFTGDWGSLEKLIKDFDSIKKPNETTGNELLIDILKEKKSKSNEGFLDEEENERFESIISFQNFLLQVNIIVKKEVEEKEGSLDDKYLLDNLSWIWRKPENANENAKKFIYYLLKCRVLFDKYVIKREFARNYKDTGKWSLQRLEAYSDKKDSYKPKYIATLDDEIDNNKNNKLRALQSCLRVTYTSPQYMHWISKILQILLENEEDNTIKEDNIIKKLEEYCKEKLNESKYWEKSGFGFERIVFNYLDYLLYCNGYSYGEEEIIPKFKNEFQFRNSIEHFYPQNPIEGERWEEEKLNGFGNLALITVSGNSKFSNLSPKAKADTYEKIIEQSLKLIIMKKMMDDNKGRWNKEVSDKHEEEMFRILNQELERN